MEHLITRGETVRYRLRADPARLSDLLERRARERQAYRLVRIQSIFGLSRTGLGRLFDVSRQAVDGWIRHGVPEARSARIGRVFAVAEALRRRFVADRLPTIVDGSLPGLGGRSILETIAADDVTPVFDLLDRLESYVPSA